MDNLSSHKNKAVRRAIRSAGARPQSNASSKPTQSATSTSTSLSSAQGRVSFTSSSRSIGPPSYLRRAARKGYHARRRRLPPRPHPGRARQDPHGALDLRQLRNAMALRTAMQGRAGEMWDAGLERIEAVVERQQRMLAKNEDDRLLADREHR
jgi:hypothetical protein